MLRNQGRGVVSGIVYGRGPCERAGVSRGLLHRVEAGDAGVSIGAAFELAAVLGIPLFDEPSRLAPAIKQVETTLTLLHKAAGQPRKPVKMTSEPSVRALLHPGRRAR